jgi:hypothetical protein
MQFSGVSRFLPSKRIGALVVVVAALIASTVIIRADTTAAPTQPVARLTAEQQDFNEKDTDGDGVKDWEEELWGLSAVSDDTDGDGVRDADEIAEMKARFDRLPYEFMSQASDDTGGASSISLAGQLLISQFLSSKQTGIDYTAENVESAADLALTAGSGSQSYRVFTISDITISGSLDATTLRAYVNNIADALANKSGEPVKHELAIFIGFGQSEDTTAFAAEMQETVARYEQSIGSVRAVAVPADLVTLHLSILNAMERVKTDLSTMATIGESPLAALSALGAYADDSSAMASAFETLRGIVTQQNITFSTTEPGYAFMTAAQQATQ